MILFGSLIRRREVTGWALYPDAPRGYLAGEQDPDEDAGVGLLTVNAVPSGRLIEVWHRPTNIGPARTLVATTFSGSDGTWQVPDLPSLERYRVVAVDHEGVYESVIVEDRQPYVPV